MIPTTILNPYGVDPSLELPHEPQDVENWTEYRYFFAYDPIAEVGMSLHIGRIVEDRSIWRGILYVFLPHEQVLVRKYSGRDGGTRFLGAGPLKLTCIEPMQLWTVEFDGLMNRVQRASLTREVARDGVDELVRFHLLLDAAAPLAILRPEVMKGLTWSHHHTEQIHRMRGEFSYRGRTLQLQGIGARDHSSGPRNSAGAIGAYWANILLDDGTVMNVNIARTQKFEINTGYVYWGDGSPLEELQIVSTPLVNDASTPERSVHFDVMAVEPHFEMVVETSRGRKTLAVERVNTVASTYVPPHHEMAGTDLLRPDAAQMTKTAARVVMNGSVGGVAQLDRYVRIRTLIHPLRD